MSLELKLASQLKKKPPAGLLEVLRTTVFEHVDSGKRYCYYVEQCVQSHSDQWITQHNQKMKIRAFAR
ncbi:MAG: hypothetical protein GY820_09270 [Gammaproteobacteria bacterium]|nr:hypothetical protein [Gammaproteobacteria bacterium]